MAYKHFCDGCGNEVGVGEYKTYGAGMSGSDRFDLCETCQKEFDSFTKPFQEAITKAENAMTAARNQLWDMWLVAKKGERKA